MNTDKIILVIEELGEIISKYKNEIKWKNCEIERLNKKVKSIEDYLKEKEKH
jgi:hypothetical protein